MMDERPPLSPELIAAQELLYRKRAEARAERIRLGLPVDVRRPPQRSTVEMSLAERLAQLPEHLGWETTNASRAIRAALARRQASAEATETPTWIPSQLPVTTCDQPDTPPPDLASATVKVYPALGLAMLRAGYAPQARVYYLLRHLDNGGRGWLSMEIVRQQLTSSQSLLRIGKRKTKEEHAWRNVRGILNGGEEVLWRRDHCGRLWLRSAAKIAATLNCPKLTNYPVQLPVKQLLGGIKRVRAHLYAAFHTGREKNPTKRGHVHQPIAQATIRELTGISESSQRRYHRVARLQVHPHYATDRRYDLDQFREALCERWGNAFQLTDYRGKQGPRGVSYIAQRLPNSYSSATHQAPKGRQGKINRYIDLVTKVGEDGAQPLGGCCPSSLPDSPTRGNGADVDRLFFVDSKMGRKAHQRRPQLDHYSQSQIQIRGGGRMWYKLPAEKNKK